ncbi:MAG: hypothetical protein C4519_09500 [Desulfobacteraceae bacterium]|nr:MAG: hypothetical protein C4519_09500 [Desulfobacteraceae bacterium]
MKISRLDIAPIRCGGLLLAILAFFTMGLIYTNSQASDETTIYTVQKAILPVWIKDQKIRAGYLYFYNDTSKISEIKKSGLNMIIVKAWQFHEKQTHQTLLRFKRWGEACYRHDLHMLAAYNWQPQGVVLAKFRPAVFSDGSEATFVCPLDRNFWEMHMSEIGGHIAQLSLKKGLSIDGVLIDLEMYGTEKLPNNRRNYSDETCYCDVCFSDYIAEKSLNSNIVAVDRRYRASFLKRNSLYEDYHDYIAGMLNNYARHYRAALHSINPQLFLGVYPYTTQPNWVIEGMARAFGTPENPVLLYAVDTYYKGGYKNIPERYEEKLEELGINGLYVPGYLFRKYSSSMINENIVKSLEKSDGYWLFKIPQLWYNYTDKNEKLANGSQREYWDSICDANKKSGKDPIEINTTQ